MTKKQLLKTIIIAFAFGIGAGAIIFFVPALLAYVYAYYISGDQAAHSAGAALLGFFIFPAALLSVPTVSLAYAFYKTPSGDRFKVFSLILVIVFLASFVVPPTSYYWSGYIHQKYTVGPLIGSCDEIEWQQRGECIGKIAVEKNDPGICDLTKIFEVIKDCNKFILYNTKSVAHCDIAHSKVHLESEMTKLMALAECYGRAPRDDQWKLACERLKAEGEHLAMLEIKGMELPKIDPALLSASGCE